MSEKYPRVAIVTGATSGIGEAIARRLVKAGYAVLGNGRNKAKLDALEHELGTLFLGLAGDASEKSLISEMFSQAESQFGRNPDIVVVNAGQGLGGSVKDADLDDFDHIQKLNVTGALRLMQKAAKVLEIKQKNSYPDTAADIVVIGSVSGRH
ncbi:MAG: SDR family oxidoreductase, partial [Spirochaetota bacterium]|nr:SDR family oxidoreductase [Spirochaetota bacterium]